MSYAAYGLGQYFHYCIERKPELLREIVLLCDKDPDKWGKELFGKHIVSPKELANFKDEFSSVLVFTPFFYEEIRKELTQTHGFLENEIKLQPLDNLHLQKKNEYRSRFEPLQESVLQGAHILPDRTAALKFMPKYAICCEVGVAYGDFSKLILEIMSPKKFYAIDYYSKENPFRRFWDRDHFRQDNMPHKEWYENRFANQITSGLVEICQGYSWDVLSQFPDDFFDYAYVDAAHDYESVRKDIEVLQHKIKDGGYIQFNDYTPSNSDARVFYGVVPAVNKWVNATQEQNTPIVTHVKYLCLHPYNLMDIVIQVFKKGERT